MEGFGLKTELSTVYTDISSDQILTIIRRVHVPILNCNYQNFKNNIQRYDKKKIAELVKFEIGYKDSMMFHKINYTEIENNETFIRLAD